MHALSGTLIRSEVWSAQDVGMQSAAKLIPERFAALLAHLLERLHHLPQGRYLLSHAAGSPDVFVYQSTNAPTGKVHTP